MIKETIKRLKTKQPKYFQRWFYVYVFTLMLGAGTEMKGIQENLPDNLQSIPKYLITIGTIGLFMSRLPEKQKEIKENT